MKANKIISINLPILATLVMAIAFTLSCTSDFEDQAKNSSSGGENSSSSNEQSSSSIESQSSSSGIPDICCPTCAESMGLLQCFDVCSPPVLVGNEYVCFYFFTNKECCPPPNCDDYGGNCPPICAPPVLVGNEYLCAETIKSSSSVESQSSSLENLLTGGNPQ